MTGGAGMGSRRRIAVGLIALLLTGCGGSVPGAVVTVTSELTVQTSSTPPTAS